MDGVEFAKTEVDGVEFAKTEVDGVEMEKLKESNNYSKSNLEEYKNDISSMSATSTENVPMVIIKQ